MIRCKFQNPGVGRVPAALNGTTGWGLSGEDLVTLGTGIVTLKRLLNVQRGLGRSNDCLPGLLLAPLDDGGTEGNVPDLESLLAGAYAEYGWDPERGAPLKDALEGLDLASGQGVP